MPSSPCAHSLYSIKHPTCTTCAAQITLLVATVPREATARSGKNDTEDDVRYVRGSFTGHLQLLTVTVWLDLLYWRYSVQQGMDPPAVLKVKVAAQSCHPALSVRCTPPLSGSWLRIDLGISERRSSEDGALLSVLSAHQFILSRVSRTL